MNNSQRATRFAFLSITLLLIALGFAPARAETRVALVIGNGAYQNLRALKNPPNDARDLTEALKKLGFDVDLGVDLVLADMQRMLTVFARRAETADVALAFFAGHGMQAADQHGSAQAMNYLLPVDADIRDAADLSFLLTARDILARLQAAGSVRILILDACRDNPIPQRLARGRTAGVSRGLGPEPKTGGTLIAYSTQPGTTADDGDGRNSPFSKALLDHIAEPGLDIRLMFADVRRDVIRRSNGFQTPETSDSLDGRFVFVTAAPAAVTTPDGPAQGGHSQSQGATLKDCDECPDMIAVPAGRFSMGSPEPEAGRLDIEGPTHTVDMSSSFAVGRYAVTRDQFEAFVKATGYRLGAGCRVEQGDNWVLRPDLNFRDPGFPQDGRHPVVCINWDEANAYVRWLSDKTGKTYRLLTEAEREYVSRAGTLTAYWWGNAVRPDLANYDKREPGLRASIQGRTAEAAAGAAKRPVAGADSTMPGPPPGGTVPVHSYQPNPWGIYQVHGNVAEWVEDCWNRSYNGAGRDRSPALTGNCERRILRGGAWNYWPSDIRAAYRESAPKDQRFVNVGFRVARDLDP
jgi:formylglycine-generating enzyme required for sulfatase activity